MRTPPRTIFCLAFLAVIGLTPLTRSIGQEDGAAVAVSSQLAELKNLDMEVRIAALRELMTSLDSRLPEALLPLLGDEGNSIRRLAARSIGSRWWQIPEERVPAFITALKRNAASDFHAEANMARRAIGLLERDYDGDMFARSANQRWVIYERRGLPCLIDTETETEELLGWSADEEDIDWLAAAWGNDTLNSSVHWHAKKEIVALTVLLHRKASIVWVWEHRKTLRKLTMVDFAKPFGVAEKNIFTPAGFFANTKGWKEDELLIDLYFGSESGDTIYNHEAVLAWDAAKNIMRVVSHQRTGQ